MIYTEQRELPTTPEGTLDAKTAALTKELTFFQKLTKAAKRTAVLVASLGASVLLLANPSGQAEAASCIPDSSLNCDPKVAPDPSCPRVNYLLVNAFALDNEVNKIIVGYVPHRKVNLGFYEEEGRYNTATEAIKKPETANNVNPDIELRVETLEEGRGYASIVQVIKQNPTKNNFKVEQTKDHMGRPIIKVSMTGDHAFTKTDVDQVDHQVKDLNAYGLISQRELANGSKRFFQAGPRMGQPEANRLVVPFDCLCHTESATPTHVSHEQFVPEYQGNDLQRFNSLSDLGQDYFPSKNAFSNN